MKRIGKLEIKASSLAAGEHTVSLHYVESKAGRVSLFCDAIYRREADNIIAAAAFYDSLIPLPGLERSEEEIEVSFCTTGEWYYIPYVARFCKLKHWAEKVCMFCYLNDKGDLGTFVLSKTQKVELPRTAEDKGKDIKGEIVDLQERFEKVIGLCEELTRLVHSNHKTGMVRITTLAHRLEEVMSCQPRLDTLEGRLHVDK